MKTLNIKNKYFLLTVSILLFSVDSIAAPPVSTQYREARFNDLKSINTLEKLFNKDTGKIRLFLLFSPTWPVCARGARWVQKNILDKYPDADFEIYAVWMPVIRGDSRLAVPGAVALLPDLRVHHFWDQTRISGTFFKKNIVPDVNASVAWDMFFLYDKDAKWDKIPGPLVEKGRTVIATSGSLGYEFGELLKQNKKSSK